MRKIILIFCCFLLINCNKKQAICKKPKQFEMYQASEMALLMEQMYVENAQLKKRILNHEKIGKFPEFFNTIYTSNFTDSTDNDAFFKENAKLYITTQKLIYEDSIHAKTNFNNMVNTCITCHEQKCGGPIVKIKKLYLK
jgi:hypothetical protein